MKQIDKFKMMIGKTIHEFLGKPHNHHPIFTKDGTIEWITPLKLTAVEEAGDGVLVTFSGSVVDLDGNQTVYEFQQLYVERTERSNAAQATRH